MFGYGRMQHAEAADMGFVDDRVIPRDAFYLVVAPGESRIDHLAFGDKGRAVPLVKTQISIRRTNGVAEEGFGPLQFSHELFGIGVNQQLVGVEPVSSFRL